MRASYAVGPWWLAVAGDACAAVPEDMSEEIVAAVWDRLAGGEGVGAVLDSLAQAFGTSLTAIPPFAVVVVEADGVRAAVRGEPVVEVRGADAVDRVSGAGVTTWTERFIPGATSFRIELPAESGEPTLPLRSGVVRAGGVQVELTEVTRVPAQPENRIEPAVPAASTEPEEVETPVEPVVPAASAGLAANLLVDTVAIGLDVAEIAASGDRVVSGDTVASEDTVAPDPTDAPGTQEIPAESASVIGDDPPVEQITDTVPASRGLPQTAPVRTDTGVADTTVPAADVTSVVAAGDHDGATISAAQLRAAREAAGDHDGATISAAQLRASRAPATAPTPVGAGRIRLSTGEVVELDRPIIVGRRPRTARVTGSSVPRLVAVESPQQDISRNHVEIRPEGDSVIVIDLNTTNGTTLLRTGTEPVRLHPGEQTVVVSGDAVDLGDGITILFEDVP